MKSVTNARTIKTKQNKTKISQHIFKKLKKEKTEEMTQNRISKYA